ncbi:hypothetical protein [Aquimarina agarilytica]|uniref:hypothetical protein n=1 Tax=Aquimarina agarilytica TaxID=1087449 RepID=UPI000288CD09|nr:hypothetical protein [Aquimarina agarilytica]
MKTILNVLLVSLLFSMNTFSQNADFGNMSYKEAIALSEKQMVLTQQIAKARMLQIAEMPEAVYKKELENTIKLFDKNFRKLQFNSKELSLNVKTALGEQSLSWFRYKKLLSQPKMDANLLLKKSKSLLEISEKVLVVIKNDAERKKQLTYFRKKDKVKAKANSFIENQKMRLQQMCLYYAASKVVGKKDEDGIISKTYLELYDELIGATSGLEGSELNTSEVYNTLADIKQSIDNLYKKRKNFIGAKVPLEKVISTTENLESLLSEVTEHYSLL